MIKEIKIKGRNPIAYTDFSAIYLSNYLTGRDYEVARIHELSHIWLQHQTRTEIFRENNKNINNELLNVALDYEIAKYIYTPEDNLVFSTPRSYLASGISTDMANKISSKYAEEIYFELLKSKNKNKNFDKHIFKKINKKIETRNGIKTDIDKNNIIEKAIKEANKYKKNYKIENNKKQLKNDISSFKAPRPSLSSEIDCLFGRNKIIKVKSYRRPSRRNENDNIFLTKGSISVKKIPKITVYVDRSGSFSNDKTLLATETLKKIILKYRGKIKQDTIYFNDNIFYIDSGVGDGGTNYNAVMQHIEKNKSELSIIITDDDYAENNNEKIDKKRIIIIPIGCNNTLLSRVYGIRENKI
jgi:hypothetical protein